MDMSTVVIVIVWMITAKGYAALGLWLRWRERHEQAKGRPLVRVAEVVARGGRLEWNEQRGKRHRILVRVTPVSAGTEDPTT